MKKLALALAFIPILLGCASYLEVHNSAGKAIQGVPVRLPLLADVKTNTTYNIDSSIPTDNEQYRRIQQACADVTKTEIKFLPLGEQIFVSFKPARFGKSEFKIEFNESGTLKSISVNSDSAASVESAASLLGTILPFLSAPMAAEAEMFDGESSTLENLRKQHCILKSHDIVSVRPRAVDR